MRGLTGLVEDHTCFSEFLLLAALAQLYVLESDCSLSATTVDRKSSTMFAKLLYQSRGETHLQMPLASSPGTELPGER